MGSTTRRVMGLLVSAMVLLSAACNAKTTKPAQLSEVTTPAAVSTSDASDQEQAVIAAYKGFYGTLLKLGGADEETVRGMLEPYGTGVALERVAKAMANLRSKGQEPAGEVVFGPIETQINGDSASTTECRDASTETIVDSATQQLVSTGQAGSLVTATLERESDGSWRLMDYDVQHVGC